jgi:hypothetical protein
MAGPTAGSAVPVGRARTLARLDEAAAGRAVAWVSAEGVGVAPAIPTLGDRRALVADNYGNWPEPIPFLHILAVSDHDVRGERGPLT